MDVRNALKSQYRGGLEMMRQCVERCPNDLWTSGEYPRSYDRIATHAVFYTDLYMRQNVDVHENWQDITPESYADLDEDAPADKHIDKQHLLNYLDYVYGEVDETVDGLDLDTEDPGFYWYKNISKMEHQMMNLRHLQGHVGQLSELLMLHGIDIDWVAKHPRNA
ncbi:MAG: hypothetical protein M3R13_11370 [Armatimonadota bacterium]|nr:hypothetical protein [Armatimonadota bacterium]